MTSLIGSPATKALLYRHDIKGDRWRSPHPWYAYPPKALPYPFRCWYPNLQQLHPTLTLPFVEQVHQGYFDIFFPIDFNVAEDMYSAITGKLTRVLTQEEFLKRWAYTEDTETLSGENPMLLWYKNASTMLGVT